MSTLRKQARLPQSDVIRTPRAPLRSDTDPERLEELGRVLAEARNGSASPLRRCAHDLRGVLGAADGYVQLLELCVLGPISDRQIQEITRIRTLLGKAFRIIDEFESQTASTFPD